jgi:exosortase
LPNKGPKARSRPASDALALQVKEWAAANVWFPARPIRDIILRLHPPPAEESVAIERTAASRQDASHRDAATTVLFLALALGALWFVCCRHLSEEWRFNEQYSYGWFVPFFVAYLFWLRWEDRPQPEVRSSKLEVGSWIAVLLMVGAAVILLPLRVFEVASSDYRPLSWLHAFAVVTITLSIIYLIGGGSWLRHFAFPVLFFLTAVPWVTAIEAPVIEGLMRGVAAIAAETLALFGIPAEAEGNLLRLPFGLVGVNEACSGVRSLQTSIMIGLLFGELKRLNFGQRIFLVVAGVGIALFANFLRVLFLVSMASRAHDVSVVNKWHDLAGYGILLLVFIGTMWMASKIGGKKIIGGTGSVPSSNQRDDTEVVPPPIIVHLFPALFLFIWLVAVEVGVEGWYRFHERNAAASPAWSVRWPTAAPAYRELKTDERVRELLRYNSAREAVWRTTDAGEINYMFFFRWNPGAATILRARAHRPDVCLPSAGWTQIGRDRVQSFPISGERSLPFRCFTFAKAEPKEGAVRAHAYYCLHEDRVHAEEKNASDLISNWDLADRWRVAKYGIRNLGQQVLEVIILAPAGVDEKVIDQRFGEMLPALIAPES